MNNADIVKMMDMAGISSLWRGLFSAKFCGPYDKDIMNSSVYADIINSVAEETINRTKKNPWNVAAADSFRDRIIGIKDGYVMDRVKMHLTSHPIEKEVSIDELKEYISVVCSPFRIDSDQMNMFINMVNRV